MRTYKQQRTETKAAFEVRENGTGWYMARSHHIERHVESGQPVWRYLDPVSNRYGIMPLPSAQRDMEAAYQRLLQEAADDGAA